MGEQRAFTPAVAASGDVNYLERQPCAWGTIRHFRKVGKDWIEVEPPVKPLPYDPYCRCTPCQLDRAVAALGGENLL